MKFDKSFWLFIMVVGLGWWVVTVHDNNKLLEKENERLQKDNTNQSKIIASQSFEFNRINQLTSTAYRNGLLSEAKSQEKVIEYRTILKKEPTCDLVVPQFVTDGLLNYTYRLRASTLYGNPERIDAAGVGAITARKLTYCQAIEWIDPLLKTIDKANTQLEAIEQAKKKPQAN
nr:hypothetical protein [Providencia rettgeri]